MKTTQKPITDADLTVGIDALREHVNAVEFAAKRDGKPKRVPKEEKVK